MHLEYLYMLYLYICSSRDKTNLNDLITDDTIKIILQNAGLTKICEGDQISCTIGKNYFMRSYKYKF